MMRRGLFGDRWTYVILFVLMTAGFWWLEQQGTKDPYPSPAGAERTYFPREYLPGFSGGELVSHDHYLLSYSEPYEQAAWVAYTLKREHLTTDDRERPFFVEDPKVATRSAHWRNYKASGYDRGHLCPAGDRRFSEAAYNQTFYTSNISPQHPEFNAGVWNELEKQVRRWAREYGQVHVVTGGVLEPGLPRIGEEGVAVPRYFYKVVFRGEGSGARALGFLIPNEPSGAALESFLAPLDRLESLTGIDFFAPLPEPVQEALESRVEARHWKF